MASEANVATLQIIGGNNMLRDWLLTLLVISPYLLMATIVVLAVIRKLIQSDRIRRAPVTSALLRQSGSAGGRK
jgi:hypothetical protein